MTRSTHIPVYSPWDLDTSKLVHAQRYTNEFAMKAGRLKDIGLHRIDFFVVRWVRKGAGRAYINHIPIDLRPNLMIMGNPTHINQYELDLDQELDIRLIAFNEELIALMNLSPNMEGLLYNLSNELQLDLSDQDLPVITRIFDAVFDEFEHRRQDLFHKELLASHIRVLLQLLFRMHNRTRLKKEGLRYRVIYRDFIDSIEKNYVEKHAVADYAEILFIHEKTLNRACKRLTGLTALKIIQNRINFEAKRMLATREMSVKEIGYHLGFRTAAHFSKFFSTLNTQTPGQFRKRIRS